MAAGFPTGARSSARRGRRPGVTEALPLIEQPLMASYEGRVEGVLVRGMQRAGHPRATRRCRARCSPARSRRFAPGADNVAIGARLAEALGANVGGQISLISPQGRTTPFGTVPRIVSYNVAAIFEVGVYDYDKAFVVMPIEDAQTLLHARRRGRHGRGRRPSTPTGSARSSRRSPRRSAAGRWSPTGAR